MLESESDFFSAVFNSVGHGWPAVVYSWKNAIDFIASTRSHLARPDIAGFGMHSESLRIAVSKGKNFLFCSFHAPIRISRSRISIGIDSDDFPERSTEVLGERTSRKIASFSGGDEEKTVTIKKYSPAIMELSSICGRGLVNNLYVFQRGFIVRNSAFRDCGEIALISFFGKDEIYHAIFFKIGIERDTQESSLTSGVDFWNIFE